VPTEVWVALISAGAIAVGYFLRPVSDFLSETLRGRRETAARRGTFQYDSLIELQANLEVLLHASAFDPAKRDKAEARVESLTFVVKDDRLRELLELMASKSRGSEEWRATYGNVVRRLGEVLRDM
jgi:hypothetical protein